MKYLLAFSLLVSGCATINEICSDPDTLSRYKDYNQCYAEKSARKARLREALTIQEQAPEKTVNCYTNTYGSNSYTTCQ